MLLVLSFVFFLSGASALIFEFLWFPLAGLVFGNSLWAASIVLASFMGGLALGNGLIAFRGDRIKQPIQFYAILEIFIAVSGFMIVIILPHLTKILNLLFQLQAENPLMLNFIRLSTAFVLMLLPTTAMGATLPLLVKALNQKCDNFGRVLGSLYGYNTLVLGSLYGYNTLGAVLGIMMAEMTLIKWFGLKGTGLFAAGLNCMAAILAFGLSKKLNKLNVSTMETQKPINKKTLTLNAKMILAVSFITGFLFLSLEMIWFRFIMLFTNAFSLHFALILASVLSGISCGGFVASKWFKRTSDADHFLMGMLLLIGALVSLLYNGFIWYFYIWVVNFFNMQKPELRPYN